MGFLFESNPKGTENHPDLREKSRWFFYRDFGGKFKGFSKKFKFFSKISPFFRIGNSISKNAKKSRKIQKNFQKPKKTAPFSFDLPPDRQSHVFDGFLSFPL